MKKKIKGWAHGTVRGINLVKFNNGEPYMFAIYPTKSAAEKENKNWDVDEPIIEVEITLLSPLSKVKKTNLT